ncbi:hypothetical protein SAMN05192541_12285 [Bradyrhizobium arachidis]|nr:hypothetical protein SAMN05192541_12285 [Bradyrhizobium arachidis]
MIAGRYAHAKQFKRHQRQLRILRSRLGWIIRDIHRKIEGQAVLENTFALPLSRASQIRWQQQRQRGFKLYSFHAPEAECIGKGKAAAPCELMAWTTPAALSGNIEPRQEKERVPCPIRTLSRSASIQAKTHSMWWGSMLRDAIILRKKRSRNPLEQSLANVPP